MGLLSALYTGVSGLQSFGDGLQVIGDNIANTQTVGFKAARAEFSDLLSQTIGGTSGRGQLGRGVQLQKISSSFSQGSFTSTDRQTDIAIDGNGFFVVKDPNTETEFYTRDGQFTLNADGQLVTNSGKHVQGYQFDAAGNVQLGATSDIDLNHPTVLPNATKDATISAQLAVSAPVQTFDITDPTGTSAISTTMTVYDERGSQHQVQVYFNKNSDDNWSWHAVVGNSDVGAVPADGLYEGANGTLTFDPAQGGVLSAFTANTVGAGWAFTPNPQTIAFNFGAVAGSGSGDVTTTQNAGQSAIIAQTQDGYAQGSLSSINISRDGVISGVYTNGRTLPIGQIALANFRNLNGLVKAGSGVYNATADSGQRTINRPNTAGLGSISSNTLELSNVDLANEFVNLIQTQRAYQANTKIITVGDQLLSELTNLIR